MKTIPLAEAKARLSGLVEEVVRRDERVMITKRGHPAVVLMSHEEAAGLDATLEIMSDPDFYAEILRNRRALDRGRGRLYTLSDLFGEEGSPGRARSARPPASRGRRATTTAPARSKAKSPRSARRAPARPRPR